jgi:hypothetical protein
VGIFQNIALKGVRMRMFLGYRTDMGYKLKKIAPRRKDDALTRSQAGVKIINADKNMKPPRI